MVSQGDVRFKSERRGRPCSTSKPSGGKDWERKFWRGLQGSNVLREGQVWGRTR